MNTSLRSINNRRPTATAPAHQAASSKPDRISQHWGTHDTPTVRPEPASAHWAVAAALSAAAPAQLRTPTGPRLPHATAAAAETPPLAPLRHVAGRRADRPR